MKLMVNKKTFGKAVLKVASYHPKKKYRMPDNAPPKREQERRFKMKNNFIVEVKNEE